ncbi:hypothetical protein [Flavobacterium sp.]|uniref:hypothetical protein n=1 Tax=Flavobacterium sp. TaxID=239 RepID=UPI0012217BFE|nr:hypothetical protein [Flavobacterium sp.]RZJ70043.1 MAG: hypothetical protein EOO49_15430 [Flavobacterium sp.]
MINSGESYFLSKSRKTPATIATFSSGSRFDASVLPWKSSGIPSIESLTCSQTCPPVQLPSNGILLKSSSLYFSIADTIASKVG